MAAPASAATAARCRTDGHRTQSFDRPVIRAAPVSPAADNRLPPTVALPTVQPCAPDHPGRRRRSTRAAAARAAPRKRRRPPCADSRDKSACRCEPRRWHEHCCRQGLAARRRSATSTGCALEPAMPMSSPAPGRRPTYRCVPRSAKPSRNLPCAPMFPVRCAKAMLAPATD